LEEGNTTQAAARRSRILIILAVVCVLAGIGVVALWPREREPEYNGKKLSEWLEISASRKYNDRWPQAEDAVRHIGTNALPWLSKWMSYESPKWKDQMARWKVWNILPRQLYRLVYNADFQTIWAAEGFRILAPTSEQVSDELARLANRWPKPSSTRAFVTALNLGPAGLPILFNVATNRTGPVPLRCAALERIGAVFSTERTNTASNFSTNNVSLVPGLMRCLEDRDTDPRTRAAVTATLREIAPEVLTNEPRDLHFETKLVVPF
jgi:hypothetical protein